MENSKNKSITFLIKGLGAFVIINAVIKCVVLLYKNRVEVLSEDFYSMMDARNIAVIALFLLALLFVIFKRKELSNYIKQNKESFNSEMLNMANKVFPFIFLPGIIKYGIGLINSLDNQSEAVDLKMIVLNAVVFGIFLVGFLFAISEKATLKGLIAKIRK